MDGWRLSGAGGSVRPPVPSGTAAVRAWMESTFTWLWDMIAREAPINVVHTAAANSGSPCPPALAGFVSDLLEAVRPWSGPEPLRLLRHVISKLGPEAVPKAMDILPNALLPRAGRRGVVQQLAAWKDIGYTAALECLLCDERFTAAATPELLQNMAITYWIRVRAAGCCIAPRKAGQATLQPLAQAARCACMAHRSA